jgi:hypothetical protein
MNVIILKCRETAGKEFSILDMAENNLYGGKMKLEF